CAKDGPGTPITTISTVTKWAPFHLW
nr:immunoglobulin heavy chain junction region [Macaca mulatta]